MRLPCQMTRGNGVSSPGSNRWGRGFATRGFATNAAVDAAISDPTASSLGALTNAIFNVLKMEYNEGCEVSG